MKKQQTIFAPYIALDTWHDAYGRLAEAAKAAGLKNYEVVTTYKGLKAVPIAPKKKKLQIAEGK